MSSLCFSMLFSSSGNKPQLIILLPSLCPAVPALQVADGCLPPWAVLELKSAGVLRVLQHCTTIPGREHLALAAGAVVFSHEKPAPTCPGIAASKRKYMPSWKTLRGGKGEITTAEPCRRRSRTKTCRCSPAGSVAK